MSSKEFHTKCRICGEVVREVNESHLSSSHGFSEHEYYLLFERNNQSSATCRNANCFLDSKTHDGFCVLHSADANKDFEIFKNTLDTAYKYFKKSKSDYNFEGIIFPAEFIFSDYKFDRLASFNNCIFHGPIKCPNHFEGELNFEHCHFYADADFGGAIFDKIVRFNHSEFEKNSTFFRARFRDKAAFWGVKFKGNSNFRQVYFYDQIHFGDCSFPEAPNEIHFITTRFEKPDRTLFSGVDLTTAIFRWSLLTNIKFENVKWPQKPVLQGSRRFIRDEISVKKLCKKSDHYSKTDYLAFTKDLYQQLTNNYEKSGDFKISGDFYYGEMECYRKMNPFRRFLPSLINIYRVSSGYGLRYIRAGVVLLVLLSLFANLHMFTGLKSAEFRQSDRIIHYTFAKNLDTSLHNYFIDFSKSIVYCGEVLIREEKQDRIFSTISIWGDGVNVVLSILIYLQAILFMFAVKRQFKRN
ncbi:MAG: pentapeptide repeat-containing protein [Tissierellales bacterium]|nr:pentapeptide repeat-containing protein [Tissierellales bacterium]